MIVFHGVPISVHARKVIVTALLKGIDYTVEPVIPFNPPANWPALSPTGLIPVMQNGDYALPDSSAICQYLEDKYPSPAILPEKAEDRGRALWFDAYAGGTIFRQLVHGLFFQKVIRPGILKETTDQSAIDAIFANVQPKIFGYLESQVSGKFLVGTSLTIADIAVVSNLINFQYLGFAIDRARYPKLADYSLDVTANAAIQKALAAERPFADQMGLDRTFVAGRS